MDETPDTHDRQDVDRVHKFIESQVEQWTPTLAKSRSKALVRSSLNTILRNLEELVREQDLDSYKKTFREIRIQLGGLMTIMLILGMALGVLAGSFIRL